MNKFQKYITKINNKKEIKIDEGFIKKPNKNIKIKPKKLTTNYSLEVNQF